MVLGRRKNRNKRRPFKNNKLGNIEVSLTKPADVIIEILEVCSPSFTDCYLYYSLCDNTLQLNIAKTHKKISKASICKAYRNLEPIYRNEKETHSPKLSLNKRIREELMRIYNAS
jgi:hypothetical protein